MVEDPIRKYPDATRDFNNAFDKIHKMGTIVESVSRYLNNKPHTFMISNVDVRFPFVLSLSPKVYSLDANTWPSAKEMADAIVELENRRKKLRDVWDSLSEADKEVLHPPDTKE